MLLSPSEIRFTQDSINNVFDKRSRHSRVYIGDTLDELLKGQCSVSDIPTITVVWKDNLWYTVDNRRLWVFRQLEELGKCTEISVRQEHSIPSRKFTTINKGQSVRVRGPTGGSYWRSASAVSHMRTSHQSPRTLSTSSRPKSTSVFHQPRPVPSVGGLGSSTYRYSQNPVSSVPKRTPSYSPPGDFHQPTPARPLSGLHSHSGFGSVHSRDNQSSYRPVSASSSTCSSLSNSFPSLGLQYLDPEVVRYTKNTIRSPPNNTYRHAEPIDVYRAFDELWAMDGNRRLWSYKMARLYDLHLKVPAKVKDDEDEFLEKMRADRPWLSLLDILQIYTNQSL